MEEEEFSEVLSYESIEAMDEINDILRKHKFSNYNAELLLHVLWSLHKRFNDNLMQIDAAPHEYYWKQEASKNRDTKGYD